MLVVTRLDRLARSIADLTKIVGDLEAKKVGLRILDMNIDTSTPTGRLMLNLNGSIAQFEREIMIARQREGILKAKEKGLLNECYAYLVVIPIDRKCLSTSL